MKSSIRSEGQAQFTLSHSGRHGGVQRHQQSYVDSHRQQYQMLLLAGEYRTFQTMIEYQEQSNEHHQLHNTVSTIVNSSQFNDSHPFAIGTKVFMKAKWFEFIEQMHSTNPIHTTFIRELYVCHNV